MATVQDPSHPTGVSVDGKTAEKHATTARQRKGDAALALRIGVDEDKPTALQEAGYHWDEIARILGFPSPRAAQVAAEKTLQRRLSDDEGSVAKMRDLVGRRYERLLRAVWAKSIDPTNEDQMAAQDRARAVLNDYVRLYGLAAPQEMVVHTPSASELQAFVSKVVTGAAAGLEEDDILDADIVDEDEPREIGA